MFKVCIDTNVLLHCAPPTTLDWTSITSDSEVLAIILPTVAREVDRLKTSGNDRQQRRARAASQQLRALTLAKQPSGVRVTFFSK